MKNIITIILLAIIFVSCGDSEFDTIHFDYIIEEGDCDMKKNECIFVATAHEKGKVEAYGENDDYQLSFKARPGEFEIGQTITIVAQSADEAGTLPKLNENKVEIINNINVEQKVGNNLATTNSKFYKLVKDES